MYLRQAAANFLRGLRIPSQIVSSSGGRTTAYPFPLPLSRKVKFSYQEGYGDHTWSNGIDSRLWIVMFSQAAIFCGSNANLVLAEDVSVQSSSENDMEGATEVELRKIEDGSIISNIHTSKWRIFTDTGRDYFTQGKLVEAEKLFTSALQEAKEGFGEREPHVASACNNLAELYRVKKEYNKAEPLYLEAISILEESFGPEDIRVGAAFHNLGQFYLVQRKLEEARVCYERALKIKRRVLGHGHTDYADTMYHLGTVLYLQGKEKDSEVLIQDSIRILEEGDQGESTTCMRRMRYLSQIYLRANRLDEAVNVQRKLLHVMELSKGWKSLETVIAAEGLALTLQSTGSLREAQEILERCLDARKTVLPQDHIQIAANMLHIARVMMLNASRLSKMHKTEAISELNQAKELLDKSTRIARQVLSKTMTQKKRRKNREAPRETTRDGRVALIMLLQALDALGQLEITKQELQELREENLHEAEIALSKCIAAYKEFQSNRSISDSLEVKVEYLSCLRHLSSLIGDNAASGRHQSKQANLQELKDEINRMEAEITSSKRSRR